MTASAALAETQEPDLIVQREGAAGVIRLNRPKTINAVTLEMARGVDRALDAFEADSNVVLVLLEGAGERGLCAGGDIRGLYDSARSGGDLGKIFWREEYVMNARIAKYPKPYVAFMDGLVMGGGVGLAAHASQRVVTEKTKVAMPEVGIGFFPDVGGTWLLSRSPGEIGTYFGLTGQPMNGADAIHAKFADHYVSSASWAALREALTRAPGGADAAQVDDIIRGFASTPEPGPAQVNRAKIDALFGFDAMEEIVAALQADGSAFAETTLQALRQKSPSGLKVALRLLRMARKSTSLEQCLVNEYRAALTVFESHDFVEGIRAAVIDKDRKPKWRPPELEGVTPELVARYFASRGRDELTFPATNS